MQLLDLRKSFRSKKNERNTHLLTMYCILGTLLGTFHVFIFNGIFHVTKNFAIIIFKKKLGALRWWLSYS